MTIDYALLALRILIGGLFLMHGWAKVNNVGFVSWLESLGVPLPKLAARLAWTWEILGGLGLILGYGHAIAPLLLIGVLVPAIALAHLQWNPDAQKGGWEYPAVLIGVNLLFIVTGFGRYALDVL